MQPGPRSEDINSILSRFQAWADKNPANGAANGHANGDASEEIREIPYEEAIRQLRDRQAALSRRVPRPKARRTAATSQQKGAATPPRTPALPSVPAPPTATTQRSAPAQSAPRSSRWMDNLPVIPDTEPVVELRSAASPAVPPTIPTAPSPQAPADRFPPRSAPAEVRAQMPAPPQRSATGTPRPSAPRPARQLEAAPPPFVAMTDVPAMPPVELPAAPLSTRGVPERRTPLRRSQPKPEAQARTQPEPEPEIEAAPEAPPLRPTRPAAATVAALPPRRAATARTTAPAPLHGKAAASAVQSPPPPRWAAAAPEASPAPAVRNPASARAEAPRPQRQTIPARPTAGPKVTASAVRAAKPQTRAQTSAQTRTQARFQDRTQARPVRSNSGTGSSLIQSPMKAVAPQPTPGLPMRQRLASSPRSREPRRAHFGQVLANTVQQPKALLAPRKKPAPDRTRRITTRFTTAEERRIEKQASELGMTVSAYLRQCALAALATASPNIAWEEEPKPVSSKKNGKQSGQASWQTNGYAANSPSLLGGWLSLLRNRFLGPPIRFSDEA